MARKRKTRQESPSQLMLFSAEEMSGDLELIAEDNTSDNAIEETVLELDAKEEVENNSKETPAIIQSIEPSSDIVLMLIQVIRLLDSLNGNQVRLLAMQSATLLQAGIDPLETYRLPVLPGMEFRGDTLTGIAYVSIARSFPHMTGSIGVDLSSAYEKAMSSLSGSIT